MIVKLTEDIENVCIIHVNIDHVRCMDIVICYSGLTSYVATNIFQTLYKPNYAYAMGYSTKVSRPLNGVLNSDDKKQDTIYLTKKQRFHRIVRDYGRTVIVFHVGISLISLGACYTAVARSVYFIIMHILLIYNFFFCISSF